MNSELANTNKPKERRPEKINNLQVSNIIRLFTT